MNYTYIVNPETGEILFDLFHDLITQNIRAIKLIAKKLNAVLRQKREQNMKTNTLFEQKLTEILARTLSGEVTPVEYALSNEPSETKGKVNQLVTFKYEVDEPSEKDGPQLKGQKNKMFGFKTEEEKFKLADYEQLASDYRDLADHDKAMEENRDEWMSYAKSLEARVDSLIELNNVYLTELSIRRKNDEFRQKLAVMK